MQVGLRRLWSVVAVALVGVSWVVLDPNAVSAMALSTPPAPVTFTGSMYSANPNLSTTALNTVLRADATMYPSVGTATSTAAKVGAATSAEAAGGAAAVGLIVGTMAGSKIANAMGLPTSGSFVCDVSTLAGATFGCSPQAAPTYVPNSDLGTVPPPGWTSTPLAYIWWQNCGTSTGCDGGNAGFADVTLPNFTATKTTNGVTITAPGTWTPPRNPSNTNRSRAFFVQSSGSTNAASGMLQAYCKNYWQNGSPTVGVCGGGTSLDQLMLPGSVVPAGQVTSPSGFPFTYTPGIWSAGATLPADAQFLYVSYRLGGTEVGRWYPSWSTDYPSNNPDPVRRWRNTWTCTTGPGDTATSSGFSEKDATWPAMPSAKCAAGIVSGLKLEQGTTTGATTTWKTLYDWQLPAEYTTGNPNPQTCGTPGSCQLLLERVSQPGSTRYVSCFSSPVVCADWWKETSQGTQALDSSEYRCTYGGTALALKECAIYAHAFDQGVYSNPKTGEPPTTPSTTPNPSTPGQDNSCPPPFTWTSLINPWWYYKGVSCALQDAFVPNASTVAAQVTATQTVVMGKPPFSLLGTVQPVFTGLSSGWSAGCSGTIADFDPDHKGRLSIPCTPPQSAPLTALYGVAVMAVVVATAFAVWHMLVAALGGHGAEGAD